MKTFLFFLLFNASLVAVAQKGLDEMIAAEKAFAAYAVANGMKAGFLKFIDTAAVMFDNGNPVNGYQLWMNKKSGAGILNWRPACAEIAASDDFGWTAGPWTFQSQSTTDSVVASGYFFTVWKKNSAGQWKFIFDVGTDAGPMMKETTVAKLTTAKGKGTENTLRDAEAEFIREYKKDEAKAARAYMSEAVLLSTENAPLKTGFVSWKHMVTPQAGQVEFTYLGGGISPSGDLGYAYGNAMHNGKKESYLRIWRHELTGWKIALQMVRL